MKKVSIVILCATLLVATGCHKTEKSRIVSIFEASGGGDISQSTSDAVGQYLAKHEDVRKQITPLCQQMQTNASADWATSDEGKVCAGNTRANFFGKATVKSDGLKF